MRKVTQTITRAFLNREKATLSNTYTDGNTLYLHNNAIARHNSDGTLSISMAGWPTPTTRERLNALPNVSVTQKNFTQYLNGREWNDNDRMTNIKEWDEQTKTINESKHNFLFRIN